MARRKHKLDVVEREALERMIVSRGWQLVRQRVEQTLQRHMDELVQPSDQVQTAALRGQIQGLKLALSIPSILIKEAQRGETSGV